MAGRRGPPGPPLAPGLPSRPLGGQRDREDDHRGGDGRGAFMRGGGIDVRYERGNGPAFRQGDRDYPMRPAARDDRDGAGRLPPPHRDYGNDWGRERDDRRGPSHPRGSRWQRERTRSPPPRGDRWGGGRPTRERSPDPLEARMERCECYKQQGCPCDNGRS
ncbi:hypothetical protein BCV69DRAFT_97456 [Microstroma glucosiphilum]|uniref:Uncharacterized protein n=1 Tax=Pseudomicrostroma glucosiphilum TaxID=1684307 RepID=A0A316UEG7_9BASI|nr:hypothetical protein BCV69DRAFT_97456 [Pseudomicrostroma glucosiphilum]PWN22781.1 hypothetical protein BCV69DRAFT_97456 [Pseudomicrostroma glucosiphilum]